ncbi:hypothetical protein GF360_03410 [candidate division WWE3 bacterium]|nr:hypothetical protein [candidate division WWE3 bacterium]
MKITLPKIILVATLFTFIGGGVYLNLQEKASIDNSKIPQKLEEERGFQRWITNAKNKDILVEADEFRLLEENEIYNTRWMQVYSLDEPGRKEEFEANLEAHKNVDHVIFSPSDRIFLDYRNMARDRYAPNEVHLYGQKEDKILDARVLECVNGNNCYFDRAYFLDNDVFVVHEVSLADPANLCKPDETCAYTFKVHLVDLINNKRWIYESEEKPMEFTWAKREL